MEKNGNVSLVLSTVTMSCCMMLSNKALVNKEVQLLCARAMTGALVLFDHVDTLGAFTRRSPIKVKKCALILKRDFGPEDHIPLLNAIHYSTKNFDDASSSTQSLFE